MSRTRLFCVLLVLFITLAPGCGKQDRSSSPSTFYRLVDRLDEASVQSPERVHRLLSECQNPASHLKGTLFAIVDRGIIQTNPPVAAKLKVHGSSRNVLIAAPPTRIEIPVVAPDNGYLDVGLTCFAYDRSSLAPVTFALTAVDGQGKEIQLFSETVKPAATPREARWKDIRIQLDALGGKTGNLVFTTRSEDDGSAVLAAWASPAISVLSASTGRPNVILISIDTLRADHLGCYGYHRQTSPFIDDLAGRGVRFTRTVAPASWTLPSHMSMFTGDYPSRHGVDKVAEALHHQWDTLADVLREEGYATFAVTEGLLVSAQWGFHNGFDSYTDMSDIVEGWDQKVERTVDQAAAWLEQNRQTPFFLFFHTYEPHSPLVPPERYEKMFDPDYAGIYNGAKMRELNNPLVTPAMSNQDIDHIIALYDAEIRFSDDALKRLFHTLESTGALDNTYVILTSDHGEEYGERGMLAEHGHSLFNEALHIPLIFNGPDIPAGVEIPDTVSLVDIPRTILDLVGLERQTGYDGVSLHPLIMGKKAASLADRPIMSEASRDLQQEIRSVIQGDVKLIGDLRKGSLEFYTATTLEPETEPMTNFQAGEDVKLTKELRKFVGQNVPGLGLSFTSGRGAHVAKGAIATQGKITSVLKLQEDRLVSFDLQQEEQLMLFRMQAHGAGDTATIYFNVEPEDAEIQVMLRVDDKPVGSEAVRLGAAAVHPPSQPFVIPAHAEVLKGAPAAPEKLSAGVMFSLWRKDTSHASPIAEPLNDDMLRALKTLGYLE
ncbi:sulfatase [Acidobacteriota bacterium]